jgi:hypothetical protein
MSVSFKLMPQRTLSLNAENIIKVAADRFVGEPGMTTADRAPAFLQRPQFQRGIALPFRQVTPPRKYPGARAPFFVC